MPSTFEFLVFSDLREMHDARVNARIRKHAMKDIGVSRRRPSRQPAKVALELRPYIASPDEPPDAPPQRSARQQLLPDDQALYNPQIRALACQPDPFESSIIPIDNVAQDLLQYFQHYSTQYPNNFTFTPNINRVFHSAVRDELMINCILSAAGSRLQYMQGTSPPHLAQRVLTCTQQSLRILQIQVIGEGLATGSGAESLVDCILYLAAAALYAGDETSAEIHVQAAVRVTELNGGLGVLDDPRVLIRLLGLDDVLACMRLRPCSFACTYDSGPSPPVEGLEDCGAESMELHDLASGVHSLRMLTHTTIPKALRDLVPQIIECDRTKDASTPAPAGGEPSSHELLASHRRKLRALDVRNKLLAFSATDVKGSVLRVVLIIWTLLPPNDPRQAKNAGVVAAKHLVPMLSGDSSDNWAGFEELRLWCLLVGGFGCIVGDSGCEWFIERIHAAMRSMGQPIVVQPGPAILERLISLQKRFLYRGTAVRQLTVTLVGQLEFFDSRSN